MVAIYQSKLAAGSKATGEYVASNSLPSQSVLEGKFAGEHMLFIEAIEKCSEEDLDNLQLPHPFLGKLTVREKLFFYPLSHSTPPQ